VGVTDDAAAGVAPAPGEPRVFLASKLEAPYALDLAGFRIMLVSLPCPGLSPERINEDGVAVIPAGADACVIGLADGMSGGRGGETAVRLTLEGLCAEVRAAVVAGGELRAGVLNGFERANHDVAALGTGAAATLAVAKLAGDTVRVCHVGDSEALLVGQRGKIKLTTVSHTPAGYGKEAGLLSEREAMRHAERHLLLNAIGVAGMRIELGPRVRMAELDTLVLGSDGLFDNWKLEEIAERVRRGPLDRAASALLAATLERMRSTSTERPGKPDDLSFVLVRRR
jgi:serine/threonine protein phosphatase PrpC